MKAPLYNISEIRTGVFAKTVSTGDLVYLQSKHFNEAGELISQLHCDLLEDEVTAKHLLKPGDVLFAAKGSKNFAALYEKGNPPAVASTTFFVIRLKEDPFQKVSPEFLVWFLNLPETQTILKGQAIGTAIVSISKRVLEELIIPVPNLKTQSLILEIADIQKQEKDLMQKIGQLRELQIQQQILNALQ